MDISKIIAANLTAWMNETPGLDTLQKLEAKAGIGFGTIRRAKKGEGNITIEKLTALAAAFGRHPAEMMIEHEAATKDAGEVIATIPGEEAGVRLAGSSKKNTEKTPSTVARLKLPTEREAATAELMALASQLDMLRLGMLIKTARDLTAEMPARQTLESTG